MARILSCRLPLLLMGAGKGPGIEYIGMDQKITNWLIKTMFLREVKQQLSQVLNLDLALQVLAQEKPLGPVFFF